MQTTCQLVVPLIHAISTNGLTSLFRNRLPSSRAQHRFQPYPGNVKRCQETSKGVRKRQKVSGTFIAKVPD
ncbi:MAG: hypothetical protein ACK5WR_11065, partial [Planctomycetaceae bacterium]